MATPKDVFRSDDGQLDKSVFELKTTREGGPRVFVNSQAVVFVDPNEVVKSNKFKVLVTELDESLRRGVESETAGEAPQAPQGARPPHTKP